MKKTKKSFKGQIIILILFLIILIFILNFSRQSTSQDYASIEEKEPNNTFEGANIMNINTKVIGKIDKKDKVDIFKFDLNIDEELHIVLNDKDKMGLKWNLYKESNLEECISEATNFDNDKVSGTYNASPGTYYLKVTGTDDNITKKARYAFTVSVDGLGTPPGPQEIIDSKSEQIYTMEGLNKLSYDELVETLVGLGWNDIKDLFEYNKGAKDFYSDKNRIKFLVKEVYDRGSQYTSEDDKGIPTLLEVIRAGFYLGYYNDELSYLYNRDFHDECLYAIKSIQANPNFELGTKEQDMIVLSTGLFVWNGSSDIEVINKFTPILEQYNEKWEYYICQKLKVQAIDNIISGVKHDIIMNTVYELEKQPEETEWYGKFDGFIDEVEKIALKGENSTNDIWIINSGISCISKLGKFHTNNQKGLETLTQAMKVYSFSSKQYDKAVKYINNDYEGKDSLGNTVSINPSIEELKQRYLPNVYSFDDGKIIIKTGDKVTEEKVQRLYWASKEVEAQYFRSINRDEALEPGNADDILTIVIYNSPDEYKMNKRLYGYNTDNGGMYIEGIGTFFTYERTPQESIYSLEELFRHEFTHYLQGRYVVPGLWGETEMYRLDRLTWYEEGGAEFFAGSTRKSDVLPRQSIIKNIYKTKAPERYSFTETLESKYSSGFEFYNYVCVAMDFLYHEHYDIYYDIAEYIKVDDVKGYDEYIDKLKNNPKLNQEFQAYMNELVDSYKDLTVPLVSDDYLSNHKAKNQEEIFDEIVEISNIVDAKIETQKSDFFNTFIVKGTYIGDKSQGKLKDIESMHHIVNGFLDTLDDYNWTGYKTVTAYFVNHRVDEKGNMVFDIVFHGLLD